jgi:amino acid transporter
MYIVNIVKKLLYIISGLTAYPFLALPAFAQGVDPCTNAVENPISNALCGLSNTANIGITIRNIVVFIIVIAVIIALIYLLYGGIKWVTSGGDKTQVEAARNHIVAAITGLVIVFLAIFIVTVVMSLFGLTSTNLNLPKISP